MSNVKVLRPSKSLGQLLQTVVDMPDFEDHASDCIGASAFGTSKADREHPRPLSMQARPSSSEAESERRERRPSVELREQRLEEEEERQLILAQIAGLQREERDRRGENRYEHTSKEVESEDSNDKAVFRVAQPSRVNRSSAQQRAWDDAAAATGAPVGGSRSTHGEEGDLKDNASALHKRLDLRRLSSLPHPREDSLRNDAPPRLTTRQTSRLATSFELDEAAAAAAAAALEDLESVTDCSAASESSNHPFGGERSWTRTLSDGRASHHATFTAKSTGAAEPLNTPVAQLGLNSSQWDWEADKPSDETIGSYRDPDAARSSTRAPASVAAGLRLADLTFDQAMAQMRAASQY